MATAVTIMDRGGFDQCTDNIVVVQPARARLLWVPRDVWADAIGDRINAAFRIGGHRALLGALDGLGIEAHHSVCVPRGAVERALADVAVTVAVSEHLRFWYPLTPTTPIEQARKPVDFEPPSETLRGERVHQWLGARYPRDSDVRGTDLARIERQQVFVRALLRDGFDFAAVFGDPDEPLLSDAAALDDLRAVRARWRFVTTDQVTDRTLDDGRQVLDLRDPEPKPPRWRRGLARVWRPATR